MIPVDKEQTILKLHQQKIAIREICRILNVSRNTVRRITRPQQRQSEPRLTHNQQIQRVLPELYQRCRGNVVRIQAILFMGGTCERCIIDNTSVVLAGGSGNDAIIAPEMAELGRAYGFYFKAHAIGHADRKAHVERDFHYVENNFLVAREFSDWDDLNHQARNWCETVANVKPKRSLGMSPTAAFVLEKPHLKSLPTYQLPIHDTLNRQVSVDAFVIVDTNRYSVPEDLLGKTLEIHKHLNSIDIFFKRKKIATHPRLIGIKNSRSILPGHHLPFTKKRAHKGPSIEEQALVGHSELLDSYVVELKKRCKKRGVSQLRRLLEFKRNYPSTAVHDAINEAFKYGLYDLNRLEHLILEHVSGDFFNLMDEEDL